MAAGASQEKRAITLAEHQAIIAREPNAERKAFYELAWHIGASQSDIAGLQAEDIDRENRSISYARMKTKQVARVRFGDEVEAVLQNLPKSGPLFPYLIGIREADRATEFRQRCKGLGIEGVTLHSTGMHGPNGPRSAVTRSGSRRKPLVITAKLSTVLMPEKPKLRFHRWRTTSESMPRKRSCACISTCVPEAIPERARETLLLLDAANESESAIRASCEAQHSLL